MASSQKYSSPASLQEERGIQLLPPPAPKKRRTSLPRNPSFILPPPSPPVAIPPPKSIIVPTNGVDLWHHFHRPQLDSPDHYGLPELQKKIGDTNYIQALGVNAFWDPNMKRYRLNGKPPSLFSPPPPLEPIPEVKEEEEEEEGKCNICLCVNRNVEIICGDCYERIGEQFGLDEPFVSFDYYEEDGNYIIERSNDGFEIAKGPLPFKFT